MGIRAGACAGMGGLSAQALEDGGVGEQPNRLLQGRQGGLKARWAAGGEEWRGLGVLWAGGRPPPPLPRSSPHISTFRASPPQDAKFGLCNLSSLLSSAPAPETHITSPPLPCTGHPKRRDRARGRRSARPPTFSPVHLFSSSHWLWEQCCQLCSREVSGSGQLQESNCVTLS